MFPNLPILKEQTMSTATAPEWTKDRVIESMENNQRFLELAILKIYSYQTADEQESDSTTESNGRGFNAFHAEFGSSLARWIEKGVKDYGKREGETLTVGQAKAARKMMKRYAGQILRAIEEKQNS